MANDLIMQATGIPTSWTIKSYDHYTLRY